MGIWGLRNQEDGKSPLLQRLEQKFFSSLLRGTTLCGRQTRGTTPESQSVADRGAQVHRNYAPLPVARASPPSSR